MPATDHDLEDILTESDDSVDDDLEDLLVKDFNGGSTANDSSSSTNVKDTSTTKTVGYSKYYTPNSNKASIAGGGGSLCESICGFMFASIQLFLLYHPNFSKAFCLILFLMCLYFVVALALFNPTEEIGVVRYDMSNIKSLYDLDAGKIDHWCLDGGNDNCRCDDPLTPLAKFGNPIWGRNHMLNNAKIEKLAKKNLIKSIDVAFLGESVVGVMNGNYPGKDPYFENIYQNFQNKYEPRSGSGALTSSESNKESEENYHINGLAFGEFHDNAANILWKLNHGLLHNPDFDPDVWWLVIGTEDLARWECSEEVVIMGVLRIVEEISSKRPNAQIVVNSLLPVRNFRDNKIPVDVEYKDVMQGGTVQGHPAVATSPVNKDNDGHLRRLDTVPPPKDPLTKEQLIAQKDYLKKLQHEGKLGKDPRLHRMHQYHKHDLLFHKTNIPVWSAVVKINEELKKFCDKHNHVNFFDATNIFAVKTGDDYKLLTKYMSSRGHPTIAGFNYWQAKIDMKLKEMLPEHQMESPEDTTIDEGSIIIEEKETSDESDSESNLDKEEEKEDKQDEKDNKDEGDKEDDGGDDDGDVEDDGNDDDDDDDDKE